MGLEFNIPVRNLRVRAFALRIRKTQTRRAWDRARPLLCYSTLAPYPGGCGNASICGGGGDQPVTATHWSIPASLQLSGHLFEVSFWQALEICAAYELQELCAGNFQGHLPFGALPKDVLPYTARFLIEGVVVLEHDSRSQAEPVDIVEILHAGHDAKHFGFSGVRRESSALAGRDEPGNFAKRLRYLLRPGNAGGMERAAKRGDGHGFDE